ncbi:hypothetical protein F5882DRAFT_415648 [Hyaloscypha sp. PMI_1271]|nr:hypothetical protein F5882DRAFT_415648 [Hyaloscypha sp. PMI_1271]
MLSLLTFASQRHLFLSFHHLSNLFSLLLSLLSARKCIGAVFGDFLTSLAFPPSLRPFRGSRGITTRDGYEPLPNRCVTASKHSLSMQSIVFEPFKLFVHLFDAVSCFHS